MTYSKCFNSQTVIVCYENFTKKQNSDCLNLMTCDNWVFKMGKKDENSDFTEIFSFWFSNIFVELLVTHIKLHIFWKNSHMDWGSHNAPSYSYNCQHHIHTSPLFVCNCETNSLLPAWVLHFGDKCKRKHCLYLQHQQGCTTGHKSANVEKPIFLSGFSFSS